MLYWVLWKRHRDPDRCATENPLFEVNSALSEPLPGLCTETAGQGGAR